MTRNLRSVKLEYDIFIEIDYFSAIARKNFKWHAKLQYPIKKQKNIRRVPDVSCKSIYFEEIQEENAVSCNFFVWGYGQSDTFLYAFFIFHIFSYGNVFQY